MIETDKVPADNRFAALGNTGAKGALPWFASIFIIFGMFFIGQSPLSFYLIRYPDGRNSWLFLLLALVPFFFGWLGVWFSSKVLLQRPVKTLLTASSKFRWKHFFLMSVLTLLFLAGTDLVMYFFFDAAYTWVFNPQTFFPFLLITLICFPVQASWEEVFIRGVMLQGLNKIKWMVLPSALITSAIFASLHIGNQEIETYGIWPMLTLYFSLGLMLAIFTLLSEGLELALGFHIVNNMYSSVCVSIEGGAVETSPLFVHGLSGSSNIVWETLPGVAFFTLIIILTFKLFNFTKLIR